MDEARGHRTATESKRLQEEEKLKDAPQSDLGFLFDPERIGSHPDEQPVTATKKGNVMKGKSGTMCEEKNE